MENRQEEDQEEEEEVTITVKQDSKKDGEIKSSLDKLEEAKKRKNGLELMIKERTNKFISKWGQRVFDELSGFFRSKVEVLIF